jgi:hypothetical protein
MRATHTRDLKQRILSVLQPGMTLTDVAKAAGVSYFTVQKKYKKILTPEQINTLKAATSKKLQRCAKARVKSSAPKDPKVPDDDNDDDDDNNITPQYRNALREQLNYKYDNPIF